MLAKVTGTKLFKRGTWVVWNLFRKHFILGGYRRSHGHYSKRSDGGGGEHNNLRRARYLLLVNYILFMSVRSGVTTLNSLTVLLLLLMWLWCWQKTRCSLIERVKKHFVLNNVSIFFDHGVFTAFIDELQYMSAYLRPVILHKHTGLKYTSHSVLNTHVLKLKYS